jgi:hypothetical protein
MAELSTAETTADPCCAPEQQASCCEPSAKAECCGHDEGCGCAARQRGDATELHARALRSPSAPSRLLFVEHGSSGLRLLVP